MPEPDPLPQVHALPQPCTADGAARRVGVEIELGGLDAAAVASILARTCGGTVRETGAHDFRVAGTEFGDVAVYLDTRFRKDAETRLATAGLDLAQLVVPIEIVTPPILPEMLPRLDAACAALSGEGATGTSDGILLGYGVHLNVGIAAATAEHIGGVLAAFALLEAALRDTMQIDMTRRILPFTARYPQTLVDRLVAERDRGLGALIDLYLEENPTRNSALDMLPIFADLAADRVADRVQDEAVSARPAFHYRLPDCRLGAPGWSITAEWNRWCVIEAAADAGILTDLRAAWLEHRAAWPEGAAAWIAASRGILKAHGLEIPA